MNINSYDDVLCWSYKLAKSWTLENLVPKGVTSSRKFEDYKRNDGYLPKTFPRKPDEFFKKKNVWLGWTDFFGKASRYNEKAYLSYTEASRVCQEKGIQNSIQYRTWTQRPVVLPARPDQYYKEQWIGWETFLGQCYCLPERKVASKLKKTDVRIIKHQLEMGVPGSVLARTFNVSEMQISRIKNGENWIAV